jgi:hypothetical protein
MYFRGMSLGHDTCAPRAAARAMGLATLVCVAWAWAPALQAGCVITKAMHGIVGTVTADLSNIVVRTEHSSVTIARDQVLWWNADPAIDTLLKTAKVAGAIGLPLPVIKNLLAASMQENPGTIPEASRMYQAVARAEAAGHNTPTLEVPERLVDYTISFESSDLVGWLNWGPPQYPAAIRTPLFHTTRIQTTGVAAAH